MPDIRLPESEPLEIGAALARLPLESPDRSAWPLLAERLAARAAVPPPRPRWPFALAAAAALALAVALPMLRLPVDDPVLPGENGSLVQATPESPESRLQTLMAESARLEHVLAAMRDDDRAGAATGLLLDLEFEDQLRGLDTALAREDLAPEQRLLLWRQRVDLLRDYTGLQGTRQWLAADGGQLEGELVAVF